METCRSPQVSNEIYLKESEGSVAGAKAFGKSQPCREEFDNLFHNSRRRLIPF